MITLRRSILANASSKGVSRSCSRRLFSRQIVREDDIVLLQPIKRHADLAPFLTGPLHAMDIIQSKERKMKINAKDIIGKELGQTVKTEKGILCRIDQPTLDQYTRLSPRRVTPIYPQDANIIVSLLDLHPSVPDHSGGNTRNDRLEIFEAGTGHGALTLHLARAIHGANAAAPPIPEPIADKELDVSEASEFLNSQKETERIYNEWRAGRRAVIHTLDSSSILSDHARTTVKHFRRGLYYPHIDFHVGNINEFLSKRLSETNDVFLDHGILDIPGTDHEMEILGKCIKPGGLLITFCPSVTQIMTCFHTVKEKRLPFFLETTLELGSGLPSGGREWDIRLVRPRALLRVAAEAKKAPLTAEEDVIEDNSKESEIKLDGDVSDDLEQDSSSSAVVDTSVKTDSSSSEWKTICKAKIGERIVAGGFVGVWKKLEKRSSYSNMK